MLVPVTQYVPQTCLQRHHHVSPPTFGAEVLFLLSYSNLYEGLRSFVFVPWIQRQCPVITIYVFIAKQENSPKIKHPQNITPSLPALLLFLSCKKETQEYCDAACIFIALEAEQKIPGKNIE